MIRNEVMDLREEQHRRDTPFSLRPMGGTCRDIHLDHLVRVASARFSHHEVTILLVPCPIHYLLEASH